MELIQIHRDGKTYDGYFTVARGTGVVAYRDSTKSTPVGGSPSLTIAQRLLSELVDAALSTRVIGKPRPDEGKRTRLIAGARSRIGLYPATPTRRNKPISIGINCKN